MINREADSGQYTSASEVVREAIRPWLEPRIAADVAALDKAHAGAYVTDWVAEEYRRVAKRMEARNLFRHSPWPALDWFLCAAHHVAPAPLGRQRSRGATDDPCLACGLAAGR